jgi:hypothetical protein
MQSLSSRPTLPGRLPLRRLSPASVCAAGTLPSPTVGLTCATVKVSGRSARKPGLYSNPPCESLKMLKTNLHQSIAHSAGSSVERTDRVTSAALNCERRTAGSLVGDAERAPMAPRSPGRTRGGSRILIPRDAGRVSKT